MADTKISALTAATTPLAGTEVLPIVQSGVTKQVSVANVTAGRSVSALNLGLNGVTSPVTTLQIGASGSGTGTQDAVLLTKYSTDTDQFRWLWNYGGTGYLGIGTSGTSMILGRATGTTGAVGATYATIDSSGNITANIGNFVQGTAAKGINFTANTPKAGMTSQLLNWYEEGTFTPTLVCGSGSVTLDAALTKGAYTRIGRTVTVNLQIALNTISTPSGSLKIGGLPFTSVNAYFGNSAAAIWADGLTLSAVTQIQAYVELNATTIAVTRFSTGSSVNDVAGYLQGGPSTWTFFRVAATYIAA